ncbi:hypothetical protein PybrP1_004105 [[Pythium] brassicae (nom. inval.)]|nr:hypothetical protein PybrP1_004105 [[Pythium] brassicae (nom. inval.)]
MVASSAFFALLLAIASLHTALAEQTFRVDCYPPVPSFPNVTEEACLAQGCSWMPLAADGVPCAFDARGKPDPAHCSAVPNASRLECRNPRFSVTLNGDRDACLGVGCCFEEDSGLCFQPFFEGYELLTLDEVDSGWRGVLVLKRFARGPFGNDMPLLLLHVTRETEACVRVRITDPSFARFEVPDAIPVPVSAAAGDRNASESRHEAVREEQSLYRVHFTKRPFGIAVTRRDTGDVLFNSTPPMERSKAFNGLVFENQFLEISTQLQVGRSADSPVLYGLGERVAPLRVNADKDGDHYPMFARDQAADAAHSREGGDNLFGVHPFYLQLLETGAAHGVFLLSSNAMEVVTQRDALTFRATGGVLDLFVFAGPTPKDVVSQYTALVGRPEMPPYWGLGYHLGEWGTKSLDEATALVTQMRAKGVPLEALWLDIDYMDDRKSFTLDETHFPRAELKRFVDDLHFRNQFLVVIQTPAISTEAGEDDDDDDGDDEPEHGAEDAGYDAVSQAASTRTSANSTFHQGKAMRVLVKGVEGESVAQKFVWSGWSAFVDFFHPNATEFWYEQLAALHDHLVPFDGLWLDMNEPSSSCDFAFADDTNACPKHAFPDQALDTAVSRRRERHRRAGEVPSDTALEHTQARGGGGEGGGGFVRSNDVAFPFDPYRQPFAPGQNTQHRGGHGNLNSATLPMASLHHTSLHYNLHSLYGFAATKVTRAALDRVLKKRSVLLSRATYAGSGRFGGHWLGANAGTWENLRLSIAGVLQMNLFGIPLVGPNVCGYEGDASKELCVRWHQAASFFPLVRNHARKHTLSQTPVDFDPEAVNLIRDALLRRYRYLPYMYTLFADAHEAGVPVVRPLALEFPSDATARETEHQYMLGAALMVSPVVHEGAISKHVYFPNATWYDAASGQQLVDPRAARDSGEASRTVGLLTPLHTLQLHIRGGYIVPTQQPAVTTTLSRRGVFTLVVALDSADHPRASGELFVDDGDSLDSIRDSRFSRIHFGALQNTSDRFDFKSVTTARGYDGPEMHAPLQQIKVFGLKQSFRANSSLRATIAFADKEGNRSEVVRAEYFANAKTLVLSEMDAPIGSDFHVAVVAHPGEPGGEVPGRANHAGAGQREDDSTSGSAEAGEGRRRAPSKRYSVLAIIGAVVGVIFLLGIFVICIVQRRRGSAGYTPIA